MRVKLSICCLAALLVGSAPAADSLRVMHIGGQDTPGEAYDVALNGAYAYVADGDSGSSPLPTGHTPLKSGT